MSWQFDIYHFDDRKSTACNKRFGTITNIEIQDEIWDYSFLDAIIQQIESRHKTNVNDHTVIMSLYYRGFAQQGSDKDKSIGKKDGCVQAGDKAVRTWKCEQL